MISIYMRYLWVIRVSASMLFHAVLPPIYPKFRIIRMGFMILNKNIPDSSVDHCITGSFFLFLCIHMPNWTWFEYYEKDSIKYSLLYWKHSYSSFFFEMRLFTFHSGQLLVCYNLMVNAAMKNESLMVLVNG